MRHSALVLAKLRPVDKVGALVFLALVGLVVFAFMGGFQDGKAGATFIGDASAEGARIFIDGELVGVMAQGSHPAPWLETRVALGTRRLVAVSAKGESLSMPYESHDSGSASISFPSAAHLR